MKFKIGDRVVIISSQKTGTIIKHSECFNQYIVKHDDPALNFNYCWDDYELEPHYTTHDILEEIINEV